MSLQRYLVEGLAHASYLVGADGEAAVVDPRRDVDDCPADAERAGMKITATLNTNPHADFAGGFPELAARTWAGIYTSHCAPVPHDRVSARDGERIHVGSLEIEMLETPGHSPDSLICLARGRGAPTTVFTGDRPFVNDVGRPDVLVVFQSGNHQLRLPGIRTMHGLAVMTQSFLGKPFGKTATFGALRP